MSAPRDPRAPRLPEPPAPEPAWPPRPIEDLARFLHQELLSRRGEVREGAWARQSFTADEIRERLRGRRIPLFEGTIEEALAVLERRGRAAAIDGPRGRAWIPLRGEPKEAPPARKANRLTGHERGIAFAEAERLWRHDPGLTESEVAEWIRRRSGLPATRGTFRAAAFKPLKEHLRERRKLERFEARARRGEGNRGARRRGI